MSKIFRISLILLLKAPFIAFFSCALLVVPPNAASSNSLLSCWHSTDSGTSVPFALCPGGISLLLPRWQHLYFLGNSLDESSKSGASSSLSSLRLSSSPACFLWCYRSQGLYSYQETSLQLLSRITKLFGGKGVGISGSWGTGHSADSRSCWGFIFCFLSCTPVCSYYVAWTKVAVIAVVPEIPPYQSQ